jgi:FxsC-like protein
VTDLYNGNRELSETRSYFYLSYAHAPPLEDDQLADPDENVREFFDDLAMAVSRHASPGSGLAPGFFDKDIPVSSDWRESLSQALNTAEVFVPLYSPGYVARSWPGREWACFYERMIQVGLRSPRQRFVPVLWSPIRGQHEPPDLDAALAAGASVSEYEKSGLLALLTINQYHDSYHRIVNKLAKKVVALAEGPPLAPSRVLDIDRMKRPFGPDTPLAVFALAVAAPTRGTVPVGGDPDRYTDSHTGWRPFPGQKLTLAEYARQAAERLDFEVEFTSLEEICDPVTGKPGIVLIDPWFIAEAGQRAALKSTLEGLPRWVLPLLVHGPPADPQSRRLAMQVKDMLRGAGALPAESSRRASRSVSSLEAFAAVVPALVAEAERRYLRHGGGYVPLAQPGGRLRLRDAPRPETPDSAPQPAGDTPDA